MKLIRCTYCNDVVALIPGRLRACACGRSRGRYRADGIAADIAGPCVALGIDNESMNKALAGHVADGKRHGVVAFIMPVDAERVHRHPNDWAAPG